MTGFEPGSSSNRSGCSVNCATTAPKAKPQVSLTVPNRNYFKQVSLTGLDFFGPIAKAKKLICESIAQNLNRVY